MQFFFGGGNTYKLLFELKLGGCIEKIKEYIKNDGVVFGGSAGAIIMGYDIKSSECEDENNVGLVNTKGLDILNGIAIFCHYTNREADKNEINKIFLTNTSNEIKIVALPEEDTPAVSRAKRPYRSTFPPRPARWTSRRGNSLPMQKQRNLRRERQRR